MIPQRFRRRLLWLIGVPLVLATTAIVAFAYWMSSDSSIPAVAAADSVQAGNQPSLTGINGQDVTIGWTASTTATGHAAVTGYTVARYAAASGGSPVATTGGCSGTASSLTCTEQNVPASTWYYTVTPVLGSWVGHESARSAPVIVVAPSLSFTANQTFKLPGTLLGGAITNFKANEGVTFHLDSAGGTVLTGGIATVGGTGQASGFTVTIPFGVADGTHQVVAVGGGGSHAVSNTFLVDTTAPVTTDNASSTWTKTAQTVTLSPTDTGGSGVAATYYTTDGSTPTTSSSSGTSITLSAQGVYTIKYFSVDVAGNQEAVKTAAIQVRIDTTAPVTTDNASSTWTKTAQTVILTPTDTGGSGVAATYYTNDGSTPTTSSSSGTSITLSAQGVYTIKYFSVDVAGNQEAVKTAANQVRIDTTAPVTTDNASSTWTKTAQTVILTPTDTGGSGVAATYYTTNGSTPTTSSSQGTSITLSTQGVYTIKYFSVDVAGNQEAVKTAANQVRIDTTAPVTTDNASAAWSSSQTVTLSPTDTGGSGVAATYYTTNGSTPTTSSSQGTSIALSTQGVYTIKYFSVDVAGNQEAVKTAANQVRIDTTAPVTTDNASSTWTKTAQTVTLSPTDTGGSGVAATYYTTDGSTPTTSSSSGTSITLSAQGVYTIKYFSVDVAGNQEAVKTAANQVRIDTTAPVTTDNASSTWTKTAQTVILTPTDTGGSGVAATYYTTNGSTPTTSSSQGTSITLSTQGVYTIKYFSVDVAGNQEAVKTAANQVRIDTTAPVTTDNASSTWTKTAQTVTLSPTDTGGSGVAATYYTTNGSTPTTSSSQGTSITLSTQGVYTIKYFSVDVAGNQEAVKTAANQVRIDTTAPVTTDNASSTWTKTAQTVTLSPTDTGGSGVAATYYTTDGSTPTTSSSSGTSITLSAESVYTIKYFSVDVAGNQEAVKTAANQVRIDTTAPTGGAVTVNGTAATGAGSTSTTSSTSFTIASRTDYTDSGGSGLAGSTLTVQSETLTGSTCGSAGSGGPYMLATTVTGTTNPAITAGFCYLYTLTGTDNAGNSASVATTVTVTASTAGLRFTSCTTTGVSVSCPTTGTPGIATIVLNKANQGGSTWTAKVTLIDGSGNAITNTGPSAISVSVVKVTSGATITYSSGTALTIPVNASESTNSFTYNNAGVANGGGSDTVTGSSGALAHAVGNISW